LAARAGRSGSLEAARPIEPSALGAG
jgi:hypothetical protein